jgi:hypothetical protein
MSIFSYHIVQLPFLFAIKAIISPLKAEKIDGLIHAETMSVMTLGSHILSLSRFFNRKIVVFAQWENESSLQQFLDSNSLGKQINQGWHIRLTFIRQWGSITGYHIPKTIEEKISDELPVVAVTIARMRYLEIPRFLQWGRPVEKLVRDHSGTTLSLASVRYPNTISTFSIWKTQKEMTDMVHGHSQMPQPKRHIDAMKERNRKDFHFEFTTLRFKAISEHGEWNHQRHYIPNNA